jgi:hypothetical protein
MKSLKFALVCVAASTLSLMTGSAYADPSPAEWQPGPSASGDNTYQGSIDLPGTRGVSSGTSFTLAGWVVDTTAQGWAGIDQVQVYSGPMDQAGTLLAAAVVAQDRPDVGSALGNGFWNASGFSAEIPGSALQPGAYQLLVYAHSPAKGWWMSTTYLAVFPGADWSTPAGLPTVSINAPARDARVWATGHGTYTLTGSAADPRASRTAGSGIDRVEVYFNGPRNDPRRQFVGTADINGTDWSLTFSPENYPTGFTRMYVYARSRFTGSESVAARSFLLGPPT